MEGLLPVMKRYLTPAVQLVYTIRSKALHTVRRMHSCTLWCCITNQDLGYETRVGERGV